MKVEDLRVAIQHLDDNVEVWLIKQPSYPIQSDVQECFYYEPPSSEKRRMFAELENGTATAETAICEPCMIDAFGATPPADLQDCTGNDELECQECGYPDDRDAGPDHPVLFIIEGDQLWDPYPSSRVTSQIVGF